MTCLKVHSKIWNFFWRVRTSRLKDLTFISTWIATRWFFLNMHNYLFIQRRLILDLDIFPVELWTIFLKFELLFFILFHSVFEFDHLFYFTKETWTFKSFQLTVYEILRGGKFKLSTASSAKTKKIGANFPTSNTSY